MEWGGREDRRTLLRSAAVGLALAGAPSRHARAQTPEISALPPEGAAFLDLDATAEQLADAWFAMLSLTGADDGVLGTTAEQDARSQEITRPVLDPAFLLLRASGERYVASTYVPADTLVVVRCATRTPGASTADSSLVMSDDLAPRPTVFHGDDGAAQWKVLSHATFNAPDAAICDHEPLAPPMSPSVPTSADDIALARSLTEGIGQLALQGDVQPMFDPEIQAQSASGRGYATVANWMPSTYTQCEASDFLVTRNGDVLVSACVALQAGTLHGEEVATARDPRIPTWRLHENGARKQIAYAGFATPPDLPDGEACVTSG